jgi:hypothetical protein
MDKDVLAALHRAIEAGSKDLPEKVLTSLKAPEKEAFLKKLVEPGYVAKKGKKYTVTEAGQAAYEAAPPEMLEELKSGPLLDLLVLVKTKKGKLTAGDRTKHQALIAEATARGYLAPGEAANALVVLPEGELRLIARAEMGEQIQQLRPMLVGTETRVKALLQRLGQELPTAESEESLATRLMKEADAALFRLAEVIARVEAVTEVAQLGKQAQAKAEAVLEKVREELRQLQALHQIVEQERASLTDLEPRLGAFLDRLEKLEQTAPKPAEEKPVPVPSAPTQSGPSEEQVWEATRAAYAELVKESNVKIPELFDRVQVRFPGLQLKQYHDLLLKWKEQDRLTLQLCGHRDAEPRSSEGIEGLKGLYFYVQMN